MAGSSCVLSSRKAPHLQYCLCAQLYDLKQFYHSPQTGGVSQYGGVASVSERVCLTSYTSTT